MRIFGRKFGGGRRAAVREKLPLAALVSTIENSVLAEIIDLSSTGARLRGIDLPPVGSALSLRLDCIPAFGNVVWSTEAECGVEFDTKLSNFELARLRREVKVAGSRNACEPELHPPRRCGSWS